MDAADEVIARVEVVRAVAGDPQDVPGIASELAGYIAAYNDVDGALAWAQKQGYKTILAWGSSYSSCLVLRLGSDNPHALKAVISYSPGEYFDDKGVVAKWAAGVKVPVYAVSTVDERPAVDDILKGHVGQKMASADVIHGSSTLRSDKNPSGAESCWKDLEPFLKTYAPTPKN